MSVPHANPGQIVDVHPLGTNLPKTQSQALVRGRDVEVIRLIVPPGKEIQQHKAKGEILVQCLEGKVAFTACGRTQNLNAGEFLYLPAGEPHSVTGVQDASVLLTVLLPRKGCETEPADNEAIRQRGFFLSAFQALVIVAGFALLFAFVTQSVFIGVVTVVAVLTLLGCLHYWLWGRRMSRSEQTNRPTMFAGR